MPVIPSNVLDLSLRSPVAPDPLSDALECLDLRGWIPGWYELSAPWGIEVGSRLGWFYLITHSGCLLRIEGGESRIPVAPGDLIIVSEGRAHSLQDKADSPTVPIQRLLETRHFERPGSLSGGGSGPSTRLFCGCFLIDALERNPLLAALPPVIHLKGEMQQALPYVNHILCLLDLEAADKEHCAPVINRLIRILFTKAVQSYTSELPKSGANRLRALADPHIGRAIELMHAQPGAPWTVSTLAKQVAMGRSTFSARFAELLGQPPLEYLTRWRMQKAGYLLRTSRAELKEVATAVGYESVAAFSKAFARWSGAPPGAYRRACKSMAASPLSGVPPI
jgi:AraC family transcriptional regulator, alkane utilization regulator